MRSIFITYVRTFAIFLACDYLWLTKISPSFYQEHIGHLMAETPNLTAALAFYLIFIAGITYFAVLPMTRDYKISRAFSHGAFFGLVTYATFDLTSQAVFKDWPTIVTIADLAWGSILTGTTTAISARLART
jgi:uncharacterized membrane protein